MGKHCGLIWLTRWQMLLQLFSKFCKPRRNHFRRRISGLPLLWARHIWYKWVVLPNVHSRNRSVRGWLSALRKPGRCHWLLSRFYAPIRAGLHCQGHSNHLDCWWSDGYRSLRLSHCRCDCLPRLLSEQIQEGNRVDMLRWEGVGTDWDNERDTHEDGQKSPVATRLHAGHR